MLLEIFIEIVCVRAFKPLRNDRYYSFLESMWNKYLSIVNKNMKKPWKHKKLDSFLSPNPKYDERWEMIFVWKCTYLHIFQKMILLRPKDTKVIRHRNRSISLCVCVCVHTHTPLRYVYLFRKVDVLRYFLTNQKIRNRKLEGTQNCT